MASKKKARRVAVYCGSAPGGDPVFLAEAQALGAAIARAGMGLVYGGASVGLMGAVADAALAAGAEGLFIETHPDPAHAISDGPNMIPLAELPALVDSCLKIWQAVR